MRSVILCVLLVLLWAPVAVGDVVKDISTGLDNATSTVIAGGQPDPDYFITPGDLTATVLPEAFPIPPWFANSGTSKWIGFDTESSNAEPIVYDFTTAVSMDGFDPSTAHITGGLWSTDNMGQDILINGVSTGISNDGNFGALHSFDIAAGMFGPGENTITFRFENAPPNLNPAGLRVEAIVEARVPEPMTMTLVLLGLVGMAAFRRRNRTA